MGSFGDAPLAEMTQLRIECLFADGRVYEVTIHRPEKPEVRLEMEDGRSAVQGAAGPVLGMLAKAPTDTLLPPGWTFSVSGKVRPGQKATLELRT